MATTAISRREDLNPRLSSASASTTAPRREGRNPRLSQHCSTKTRGSKSASQQHCSTKTRGSKPACCAKTRGSKPAPQPALLRQDARVKTCASASTAAPRREDQNLRLSSTAAPRREGRNPRLSYNFPRYGVNHHPHNVEVNPHCEVFLGGTFALETSINSSACY